MIVSQWKHNKEFWRARYEHAWLLRAEGLTYREVGERLGVSYERARQMILIFNIRRAKERKRK